jgi:hypothetical protein
MIRFYLEPKVILSWQDFINSKPKFSIALDGYVKGPPQFLIQGPFANFNHHEGVARIATRSTCAQVYFYICLGLLDTFQKTGEPRANVYINDVDQDVCLSCWLLKNSDKLIKLRIDSVLFQLIMFEDILDASAGAYPINPERPLLRKQAWIYEPYTRARADGSLYRMSETDMLKILWSVCDRIDSAVLGQSEEIDLDTMFKTIGGGDGWQFIIEKGTYARTRLFSEGVKAYVSLLERQDDSYAYTIGKMSPFIKFPIVRIYEALNKAENLTTRDNRWGGSPIIGGSPRKTGSRLSPENIEKIINDCIKREENG